MSTLSNTVKRRFTLLFMLISTNLLGQGLPVDSLDATYLNWFNKDFKADQIPGTSVDRVYQELIKDKKPKKQITVAVIDSGIEIEHEDLIGNIWVNQDEIAGNGIDDDKNGYVDDIHGWNFIGSKTGQNVNYETLEYTRVYRKFKPQFEEGELTVSTENVQSTEYENYLRAKELYSNELAKRKEEKSLIDKFTFVFTRAKKIIEEETGIEANTIEDLEKVKSSKTQVINAKKFLMDRYKAGFTEKELNEYREYNQLYLDKHLNLEFNPRKIVGDNPEDFNDRDYGNSNVVGERADHGTSVAGVIAATRDNGLGIDGIAPVKIMVIRTVPHGDEYDKDVALAIRYAVENGADIVNMSFGKDMSPQKEFVDEAVKLAEEKGVLLIHGSGNDGADIDLQPNYPTNTYLDGTKAQNWITVGASSISFDEKLAAEFSNYGQKNVDIFAPGVQILSLDTANLYGLHDGTSLAAPVVTGIAALVWSYYPDLTAAEIKEILLDTSFRINKPKVLQPTDGEKKKKVKFKTLSVSGGIVNAYHAFKKAEKVSSN